MDTITTQIITQIATSYFAHYSREGLEKLFRWVFKYDSGLEKKIQSAESKNDIEEIFREAIGVIDANAGEGEIDIDGSLVEAIRGIRFNHDDGMVTIDGSTISAPVLITGGGHGSKGQTEISGTDMKSRGTKIKVGKNAKIKIRGSARIKQN